VEDKWLRLEEMVRRVIGEEFDKRKRKVIHRNGIILNGKGFEGISEELLTSWKVAYPLVDIGQHLSLAAAWCKSNEEKAPRSQYARFLNSWLKREHNEEASRQAPKTVQKKMKCRLCESENWTSLSGGKCGKCRGLE